MAFLRHNPNNYYNDKAIQVFIENLPIEHLTNNDGASYHAALQGSKYAPPSIISCDAVIWSQIRNPKGIDGDAFTSFTVLLDIDFNSPPQQRHAAPGNPDPIAISIENQIFKSSTGGIICYVPWRPIATKIKPGTTLRCWAPPEKNRIYLYAPKLLGPAGLVTSLSMKEVKELRINVDVMQATVLAHDGVAIFIQLTMS